jgi:hypothetical protein
VRKLAGGLGTLGQPMGHHARARSRKRPFGCPLVPTRSRDLIEARLTAMGPRAVLLLRMMPRRTQYSFLSPITVHEDERTSKHRRNNSFAFH